jgi:hypothetical protein
VKSILTDEDRENLGKITTRDESGRHFTEVYAEAWLAEMESLGVIEITRPVHPTGIPYAMESWRVVVTLAGESEVAS